MPAFILEAVVICLFFTLSCLALVLDCLWFCRSKSCIIPGTENLTAACHDYMFHIKGSCAGMLIGLPCCLIAGLIAMV